MFAWLVVVPESVTARHTARKDFMRTPCPQDPCDQAILRLAWTWPTWYRWCGSLWPAMARRLSGVVHRRNSNAERLPSRQWRALGGAFPSHRGLTTPADHKPAIDHSVGPASPG